LIIGDGTRVFISADANRISGNIAAISTYDHAFPGMSLIIIKFLSVLGAAENIQRQHPATT
jgi:hypothetical protein